MEKSEASKIVVTGFGPFGKHQINASWQAVEKLAATSYSDLKERYNVDLIIEEIPVVYNYVNDRIPKLWEDYEPLFVIHVGVSHMACCLTIERKAHNSGYFKVDVDKKCPDNNDNEKCEAIETEIDIDSLCDALNKSGICISQISHDAGRYLCEYIYYKSLCIKRNRTLFIHVPETQVYSIDLTARSLYLIICNLLENLKVNTNQ